MSFSTLKTVGRSEEMRISASVMCGLQRAKQMTEFVLGFPVDIIHAKITAGPIELQNHHGDTPYQSPERLFLERELHLDLLITPNRTDLRWTKKVLASVIVFSKAEQGKNSGCQPKWSISDDQNYLKIGDEPTVCISFEDWDANSGNYKPRIKFAAQSIAEDRIRTFLRNQ